MRQGHLEQLGSRLRGIGSATKEFGLRSRLGFHLGSKGIEVGLPTNVVKIFQQSLPLFMSIVAQSACISAVTVAPSGNLHAGIPLIESFLVGSGTRIDGILGPMAQTEL